MVLDCVAHGQPPITIRWLRNGVRVTESGRLRILANGSLYIPEVRRDGEESDKGFYQCLSQNRYGAILSQRSRLTITSKYVDHEVNTMCHWKAYIVYIHRLKLYQTHHCRLYVECSRTTTFVLTHTNTLLRKVL